MLNAGCDRVPLSRCAIRYCSGPSTVSRLWKFIRSIDVHPLEERIGYKFRNPLLLAEALTHPSVGHETRLRHFDNQRLEFLGDAILQLVITEYRSEEHTSELQSHSFISY